jgi:tetrapyrrole methylase family protein/MazG family protein
MSIIILGLGPGDPSLLTRQAWELLTREQEIYLRTARHPTVAALPANLAVHSFDSLYETLDDLPAVYDAIADRILALGSRPQGVLYAVPGHPLVAETSVRRILERARHRGLSVHLVEGLSFVESVLSLLASQPANLAIDAIDGLQLADATELSLAYHPRLDPDRPALIGQLYDRRLASEVKLTLMNAYPDDHTVVLIRAAGTPEATAETIALFDLDRGRRADHLTSLFVPPLVPAAGLPALQQTIARLRAPGGCPWDREQTHQTLSPSLLEETYEVLSALDAGDSQSLCEELGDLLMQIVMHSQIAAEEGEFQMADVIHGIDAKLRRRHPHVFGDVRVSGSAEVLRNWAAIKAAERLPASGQESQHSSLHGVPLALPALARAQSFGARAARVGFDWPDLEGVLSKLAEEVNELRQADSADRRTQEMGDLLFTLVNAARWLSIDAETALRGACDRFAARFSAMERAAREQGAALSSLSPSDLDALWNRAKEETRQAIKEPGPTV